MSSAAIHGRDNDVVEHLNQFFIIFNPLAVLKRWARDQGWWCLPVLWWNIR